MIRSLLGRFFRHCIAHADLWDNRRIVVRKLDREYMTDREIDLFMHGRVAQIDWDQVALRKRTGALVRPRPRSIIMEIVP